MVLLPIHPKLGERQGIRRPGLPTDIRADRPHQLDPILRLTPHEQPRIDKARIGQMFVREQLFGFEGLMDPRRLGDIRGPGESRLDVGDQVRSLIITTLSEVRFIACPSQTPFVAKMGFGSYGESIRRLAGGSSLASRNRTWP